MKTLKYSAGIFLILGSFYFIYAFLYAPLRLSIPGKPLEKRTPAGVHQPSYTLYTQPIREHSQKLLKKGKALFRKKKYTSANRYLRELVYQYPYTGCIEEASFLLAQGLFHEGQWKESEEVIMRLQGYNIHAPSAWVGQSLLILARIYEKRGNTTGAVELYHSIIKDFSRHPAVVQSAYKSLSNIHL